MPKPNANVVTLPTPDRSRWNDGKYTKAVNFNVMPEELEMLDEMASRDGLGRSQWLRMMIRRAHRKVNPT